MVKGPLGLAGGFLTTRGIKQGCPVSPLLFAVLLSGLERRLARLHPTAGIVLPSGVVRAISYADDVKLLAKTP
jgi:retron-type reverse transcriptase